MFWNHTPTLQYQEKFNYFLWTHKVSKTEIPTA